MSHSPSGGGKLTKDGPGILTLTAGNTTHGTVMVNDGTLKLGGGDLCVETGDQLAGLGDGVAEDGHIEGVDRLSQPLEPVSGTLCSHAGHHSVQQFEVQRKRQQNTDESASTGAARPMARRPGVRPPERLGGWPGGRGCGRR